LCHDDESLLSDLLVLELFPLLGHNKYILYLVHFHFHLREKEKEKRNIIMPSKGLPGFLRRSLRRDFDEADEADRQSFSNNLLNSSFGNKLSDAVVPDPGASNNNDTINNNGNGSGPLDTDNQEYPSNGDDDDDDDAQEEEDSNNNNEDYDQKISPPARLDSAMSSLESSSDHLDNGDNEGPSSMVRQYTYRETQFEKTITTDVVKMVELRNLSWNGVPVRNKEGMKSVRGGIGRMLYFFGDDVSY
jgi:hypothetical protein